ERAFTDASARGDLEAILHPMIRREVGAQLARVTAAYALLAVPLLVERGGQRKQIDRILVVDCSLDQQIARVMRRSGLTREQVMAIIAVQATREQRLGVADDVLDNDGAASALALQVESLHRQYLRLAQEKRTAARPGPPDA
ncbi:MAG: dephospho-CoA kinase, partial [Proteobacteria bacterium]|nr:dephospho-CoA kinase [Burkholderiales bacterium]